MKKIVIFIALVILVGLAAKKLISTQENIQNQPTALALNYNIKTTRTKEAKIDETRPFLAQTRSDAEAQISAKFSGAITKVLVSESQKVKKGDLLVKIDEKSLMSAMRTLVKTLQVQESDVKYHMGVEERNENLYKAKGISKEKYDASVLELLRKKAARDATKDKIASLNADLDYLQIKAPYDGVVSALYMHEGDLALASKPILLLSGYVQKMTFSFASAKNAVAVGDMVLHDGVEVGKVSKIYPNAKNNLNVAEVALNGFLKAKNDSYASIEVVTNSATGCALPRNAILHLKDTTYVMLFNDNKFEKKRVEIVMEDDESLIIKPCVSGEIALASESKLSILPFYKNISIMSDGYEK